MSNTLGIPLASPQQKEIVCDRFVNGKNEEDVMPLEPEDLEIIEDLISQKVDSEILVLRQDLGGRLNDLQEAIQSLMLSLEGLK